MLKFELNAEIYESAYDFIKRLSAPSDSKICIMAYNQHQAHQIFSDLIGLCDEHGFIYKAIHIDRRIETVFGNIWILTNDMAFERIVGHHGIRLFVTRYALDHLHIGELSHINARTTPWLKQSDAPTEDSPSAT